MEENECICIYDKCRLNISLNYKNQLVAFLFLFRTFFGGAKNKLKQAEIKLFHQLFSASLFFICDELISTSANSF